jgi:hypothetical protein
MAAAAHRSTHRATAGSVAHILTLRLWPRAEAAWCLYNGSAHLLHECAHLKHLNPGQHSSLTLRGCCVLAAAREPMDRVRKEVLPRAS